MEDERSVDRDRTPEELRETGKTLMESDDPAQRSAGVSNVLKAFSAGDPEAAYIVGELMLRGVLRPAKGDRVERALKILCNAARDGSVQARSLLNSYCAGRYTDTVGREFAVPEGPLTDFDGKPIKIKRKGVLTPVDAVLVYENGINRLALSANVMFLCDEDLANRERFEDAIVEGLMMWQGEYTVFGGQRLRVTLDLTFEPRVFDNVAVVPVTEELGAKIRRISEAIGTKKSKERTASLIDDKRSFAASGFKWTSRSRKFIYIQSEDGRFDDYEELKHVAKHEFGHALGLGDLYESGSDELVGVEKGTYRELDGFHVSDRFYNLVMCDHHGPISNNDIEMVVLAFRENRAQLYQPGRFKGVISQALGRGN